VQAGFIQYNEFYRSMSGCRLDSSGLGLEQVAGSYEHSSEPSGSIKCGQLLAHQGLCSMELSSYIVRHW